MATCQTMPFLPISNMTAWRSIVMTTKAIILFVTNLTSFATCPCHETMTSSSPEIIVIARFFSHVAFQTIGFCMAGITIFTMLTIIVNRYTTCATMKIYPSSLMIIWFNSVIKSIVVMAQITIESPGFRESNRLVALSTRFYG